MAKYQLGANLKKARQKAGLTQHDVADKLDVFVQRISELESGDVMPRADTLQRLADLYDTTVEKLLGPEKRA